MTLEQRLHADLERALRGAGPAVRRMRSVAVNPPKRDAHPRTLCRIAVVKLEDGSCLRLFVKGTSADAGMSGLSMGGARREAAAYRILAGEPGVPALHGHWQDRGGDRSWLLLDHVAGRPLSASDPWPCWRAATDLLATLHAHFEGRQALLEAESLPDWGDGGWGSRFAREIGSNQDLEEAYRRAAACLGELPRTLIHGECFPRHVLVAPPRPLAWLIDWEDAGRGSGALDLEALTWGAPRGLRDRILRRYARRMDGAAASASDPRYQHAAAVMNRIRFLASWRAALDTREAESLLAEIHLLLEEG